MKIAVIGSNGLVGSRFASLLTNNFNIIPLSASLGFNITSGEKTVFTKLDEIAPDVIVNFAAKTNVDDCEADKVLDNETLGNKSLSDKDLLTIENEKWIWGKSAFAVNSFGTKNLAEYCRRRNTYLVYVSTDFVFDGKKGNYSEEDDVNPINWYGKTKLFGERIVTNLLKRYVIARISFPYGFEHIRKKDFIRKLIFAMRAQDEISLVEDQDITPTFIDDIVKGIALLINKKEQGIFHICGENHLSPFALGEMLNREIFNNKKKLLAIKRSSFYKNKAERGFHLSIKNDKLEKLGLKTKTIEEGIDIIKPTL